ncbi:MAG: hypothetical protein HY314_17620 [Acidobacteria bacterium]|nr:hypothetical protein [Acidobacteriota bacterium]
MKIALLCLAMLVVVVPLPSQPCCNGDGPNCPCFSDGGAWDPSGATIQDVALATLGTRESCMPDGGKPYYQMRLGANSSIGAELSACLIEAYPSAFDDDWGRDAWCSEAVSYWHREAEIPYSTGYRNSTWHVDWQLTNTEAIRTFYTVEEDAGGRGRWIDWSELDYEDFQLGVNAPVPGAYVLIRKYNGSTMAWEGDSHSMMINEMTIHQNASRETTRVEVSLIDGNAGNQVRASAVFDDILSLTPGGTQFLSGSRKILGFGIDLGSDGSPIYDPGRLHWVRSTITNPPKNRVIQVRDPLWEEHYAARIPRLISYAKIVRQGVRVSSSSKVVQASAVPDGHRVSWVFPSNIDQLEPQGVGIMIDLSTEHPLPITGLVLSWRGYLPQGYGVQWAGANGRFREADVPMIDIEKLPMQSNLVLPVPVGFSQSGATVQYVKFFFPPGTFEKGARLEELRFIYDQGPGKDAVYNP